MICEQEENKAWPEGMNVKCGEWCVCMACKLSRKALSVQLHVILNLAQQIISYVGYILSLSIHS